MNPVEKAIRKLDATQRRYTPTAFVFGVVKKYGDDNGGVLASNLAYSAFLSLFPLLLILVTILGLIASVNPSFRTQVLNAVAGQVPLIGPLLGGGSQGLFAANFALSGASADPQVTVNPLSALAPGVLRQLFAPIVGLPAPQQEQQAVH